MTDTNRLICAISKITLYPIVDRNGNIVRKDLQVNVVFDLYNVNTNYIAIFEHKKDNTIHCSCKEDITLFTTTMYVNNDSKTIRVNTMLFPNTVSKDIHLGIKLETNDTLSVWTAILFEIL